jgi:multidrug efflux pump
MKYLPITVAFTLLSSLFVALVISPTICAAVIRHVPLKEERKNWFVRGYRRVQGLALDYPGTTLILCLAVLVGLAMVYFKTGSGTDFFPQSDPNRANVAVRFPQGTNLRETDKLAQAIEKRMENYRGDLDHVVADVGSGGAGSTFSGAGGGAHLANITLVFRDYEVRARPSASVIEAMRRDLTGLAGAEVRLEKEKDGPPAGAPIAIRVVGKDLRDLERASEKIRVAVADTPGLVNFRSDLEATRPELAFIVDRQRAMLLGVNTATVGHFLQTAIFGSKVGTYRQFNDEYDITVRLPLSERTRIDEMLALRIPNARGASVPLSSLGRFDYRGGFGTINRVNQKRVVTLSGDVEGRLGGEVLKDVQARIKTMELGSDIEVRYAGEKEESDKAAAFLTKAFFATLLLILMILVVEFNSLIIPGIIMTTVVLSLIGAVLGLTVFELPFIIIMTGIGIISLAGVVVKNAIVLLAYTRQLQARGLAVKDAVAEAGETRLRPVLLTATTAVLALIPTALGASYDFHTFQWVTRSETSQFWQNMAVVIIFGLSFATVLTLVVVPALYILVHKMGRALRLRGMDLPPVGDEPEPPTAPRSL